ncbi:MAG: hypothetical protein ABIJ45_14560 [Candidatus Zixiibacteriota bacterium]
MLPSKRTLTIISATVLSGLLLTALGFCWHAKDIQEINDLNYNIHSRRFAQVMNYNPNTIQSDIKNHHDKKLFYVIDEYNSGLGIPAYVLIAQSNTTWFFSSSIHKLICIDSTFYENDPSRPRQMDIYAVSISTRSTTLISFVFFFTMTIAIFSLDKKYFPHIYRHPHPDKLIIDNRSKYILMAVIITVLLLVVFFITKLGVSELDYSQINPG